eukprot:Rmarinus@m.9890
MLFLLFFNFFFFLVLLQFSYSKYGTAFIFIYFFASDSFISVLCPVRLIEIILVCLVKIGLVWLMGIVPALLPHLRNFSNVCSPEQGAVHISRLYVLPKEWKQWFRFLMTFVVP